MVFNEWMELSLTLLEIVNKSLAKVVKQLNYVCLAYSLNT